MAVNMNYYITTMADVAVLVRSEVIMPRDLPAVLDWLAASIRADIATFDNAVNHRVLHFEAGRRMAHVSTDIIKALNDLATERA